MKLEKKCVRVLAISGCDVASAHCSHWTKRLWTNIYPWNSLGKWSLCHLHPRERVYLCVSGGSQLHYIHLVKKKLHSGFLYAILVLIMSVDPDLRHQKLSSLHPLLHNTTHKIPTKTTICRTQSACQTLSWITSPLITTSQPTPLAPSQTPYCS